jgi:hypothetical protein
MIKNTVNDYIPSFFNRDSKLNAFITETDDIINGIKDDIKTLNDMHIIEKTPAIMLNELGLYLNAGIRSGDSDRDKRIKIINAVAGHKVRGSFNLDAKPKIDLIAGGDSKIIRSFDKDDFIFAGDGLTPDDYYWAVLGTDGIDDGQGISLIGEGDEIEIAGTIYIDADNDSLTEAQLDEIELDLEDVIPAYYRVFLGYINVSNQFIIYREL